MTKVTPVARCAALLILLAGATTSAQLVQERAQLESLTRRGDERIQALQREAAELASRERTLLGDLRGLEFERRMKTEELNQIEGNLQQATEALSEVEARGVELERAASAQRPEVHARLRELYKLGRPGYLRLLLDLQDFNAVIRAYQTVAMLAERDRRMIGGAPRHPGGAAGVSRRAAGGGAADKPRLGSRRRRADPAHRVDRRAAGPHRAAHE